MIDVSELMNDPDLCQSFSILRGFGGSFTGGVWAQNVTNVLGYGVISVATPDDLLQLADADRVTGMMVFHSAQPMYETSENREATSDILVWRGENYRVKNVFIYADYGFWKAFAVRMQGS